MRLACHLTFRTNETTSPTETTMPPFIFHKLHYPYLQTWYYYYNPTFVIRQYDFPIF